MQTKSENKPAVAVIEDLYAMSQVTQILRCSRKTIRVLSDEEIAQISEALSTKAEWAEALFFFQLDLITGGRMAELLRMRWEESDVRFGTVKLYSSKTKKWRTIKAQLTSLQASPRDWPPSLTSIMAPITAKKRKALEKPGRHPEPKLCDLVVTGYVDSMS